MEASMERLPFSAFASKTGRVAAVFELHRFIFSDDTRFIAMRPLAVFWKR